MKGLLVGNYGVDNLGDEALREYFLQTFPEVEWTVVSAHPRGEHEVYRLPGGLRSLFTTRWGRTIAAFRQADLVVFGGGSLFTDVESVFACILWGLHAAVARFFSKPVLLAFQGMGPYRTKIGEGIARWVTRHAWFVSVRDRASMSRVEGWGLNQKVIQAFDPVFSLMQSQKMNKETKNVFTVIPRHNSSGSFTEAVQKRLTETEGVQSVQIVLMQPGNAEEQAAAQKIQSRLGTLASIQPVRSIEELIKALGASRVVVTQRFHGALAALAAGVPVFIEAQGEGDKLWELKTFEGETPDLSSMTSLIQRGEEALRDALAQANRAA